LFIVNKKIKTCWIEER